MKSKELTTKLFSLSCYDQRGVLSRIISTIDRPGYQLVTISQAATDVHDMVLITMEVAIPAHKIDNMIRRLEKIIGVVEVVVSYGSTLRSATYCISMKNGDYSIFDKLHQHNARSIAMLNQNQLLIHQIGRSADLQRLYNDLEGPNLISFSEQAMPVSMEA